MEPRTDFYLESLDTTIHLLPKTTIIYDKKHPSFNNVYLWQHDILEGSDEPDLGRCEKIEYPDGRIDISIQVANKEIFDFIYSDLSEEHKKAIQIYAQGHEEGHTLFPTGNLEKLVLKTKQFPNMFGENGIIPKGFEKWAKDFDIMVENAYRCNESVTVPEIFDEYIADIAGFVAMAQRNYSHKMMNEILQGTVLREYEGSEFTLE